MSALAADTLRWFAAFLLLAACAGKLRTFARFRINLTASFGVPARRAALLAPALIGIELGVAALVLGAHPEVGMTAALLLFSSFSLLLAWRMARDGALRCGCFGESERNLSGLDLLRNLLVVGAIALFLALPRATLPAHASLLAAGLASILAVIAIAFHDIVHLLRAKDG